MSWHWVHEQHAVWDADKDRIIGGAPDGAFIVPYVHGQDLPGDWWAVHEDAEDGPVVAYGRLDMTFGGDAEVLVATDPDRQGEGIGSFVLDHLEQEAAHRDLNYVFNVIREHEARPQVHAWLTDRGFEGPMDGDLRKRVRARAA